jgi:hypothetical protein
MTPGVGAGAVDLAGVLEDGHRPPRDPDEWELVYMGMTGEPCPACRIAIRLILGPTAILAGYALDVMGKYDVSVPDRWMDGYDHPVYLSCNNPVCSWHGDAEWRRVEPALTTWIGKVAPRWREHVTKQWGA